MDQLYEQVKNRQLYFLKKKHPDEAKQDTLQRLVLNQIEISRQVGRLDFLKVICEAFIELYPNPIAPEIPQKSHPGYALLKILLETSSDCSSTVADIVQICSLYLLNVLAMNNFQEGKGKVLSLLEVRSEK